MNRRSYIIHTHNMLLRIVYVQEIDDDDDNYNDEIAPKRAEKPTTR